MAGIFFVVRAVVPRWQSRMSLDSIAVLGGNIRLKIGLKGRFRDEKRVKYIFFAFFLRKNLQCNIFALYLQCQNKAVDSSKG